MATLVPEWDTALFRRTTAESGRRRTAELRELQINHFRRIEAPVADIREFFGDARDSLATHTLDLSPQDLYMTHRALAALLPGWRVEREVRYSPKAPQLLEYAPIEVAPGKFEHLMRHGTQYWVGPAGARFVAEICFDDSADEEWSMLRFTLPREDHAWLVELLPKLKEWADRHHYFRGQSIDALGSFLRGLDGAAWDEVLLAPELRAAIERNCIGLLAHREFYRANGVPLRRGIILHGPPGTGKTTIGKALARRCGVTFILATPGMLNEPRDVRRAFRWAKRFAPAILFFEDFDLVAKSRDESGATAILGEFLSCIDGVDSSEGIITIATTNNLHAIDPALRDRPNRLDAILEVPPLSAELRAEFLGRWRQRGGGTFGVEAWTKRTKGNTGAQLQELMRSAVMLAVEARIDAGDAEPRAIALADADLERAWEKLHRKARRTIGFHAE